MVLVFSGTVFTCYAQMPTLPPPAEMEQALLSALQERVTLTTGQVEQLEPIVAEHVAEQHKLMGDSPKGMLGMMKMRKRMKGLQSKTDERIQALLTADQKENYDGFWKEQRDAFRKQMKARSGE